MQTLASGWRDDPATGDLLRERATTDTDWHVRQAAVEALASGWRADPATVDLLRERATTDTNWQVRQAAVQALAAAGGRPRHRRPAARARHHRHQPARAPGCGGGAGRGWGDDPATATCCASAPPPTPTGRCARPRWGRWPAAGGEDPATADLLRERATTDTDWHVRRAAVEALASGWREDPATADAAARARHHRHRLAGAPGRGGGAGRGWRADPATGHLLRERATTDTDWQVRRAAVEALAAAGGKIRLPARCCASAPPPTPTRTCARRRCRRWPRVGLNSSHRMSSRRPLGYNYPAIQAKDAAQVQTYPLCIRGVT